MEKTRTHRRGIRAFLSDYVIPPICPSCHALLPMENPYAPFCGECRGLWEQEKLSPCPNCGLAMLDCFCLPPLLSENGVRDAIFLTKYRSGGATAPDKTIYYIKENRDERVFSFLARELATRIRFWMRGEEIDAKNAIVTALPRRKQGVRENGFDQAEVLARFLAEELEMPYRSLLRRVRSVKEQKTLDAAERRENLRNAFGYAASTPIQEKYVFLTDDVMTTGSGLYACTEILMEYGAKKVIPVVIARTEAQKEKRR